MTTVYVEATKKAINEHPPVLKAEQRGWVKGRNDCWKSADKRKCVDQSYRRRIAELQARYRLVSANGPFWYSCDGDPRNEGNQINKEAYTPSTSMTISAIGSLMYRELGTRGKVQAELFEKDEDEPLLNFSSNCRGIRLAFLNSIM